MKISHLIKLIFFSITLLSFYYIYHRIHLSEAQLLNWHLNQSKAITIIAISAVIFALSNGILSFNWYRFYGILTENNLQYKYFNYIYSVSSIAKYVPGSVLQFANRQMLGKLFNLSQANLLITSYCETFGVLIASGLLGIIGFLVHAHNKIYLFAGFIIVLISLVVSLPLLLKVASKVKYFESLELHTISVKTAYLKLFPLLLWYLVYFILSGCLLIFIIVMLQGKMTFYEMMMVISAWGLAWFGGYIVIFAPAGIGVREAVLLAMLSPMFGDHAAIITVIIFRVSLIIGDVLFAGFGGLSKFFFNQNRYSTLSPNK